MGTTRGNAQLSHNERGHRQRIVDETRASTALEGGQASDLIETRSGRIYRDD
jgi:hypothetical protein